MSEIFLKSEINAVPRVLRSGAEPSDYTDLRLGNTYDYVLWSVWNAMKRQTILKVLCVSERPYDMSGVLWTGDSWLRKVQADFACIAVRFCRALTWPSVLVMIWVVQDTENCVCWVAGGLCKVALCYSLPTFLSQLNAKPNNPYQNATTTTTYWQTKQTTNVYRQIWSVYCWRRWSRSQTVSNCQNSLHTSPNRQEMKTHLKLSSEWFLKLRSNFPGRV